MVVHNISNITGEQAFHSMLQSGKRNILKNYIYFAIAFAIGAPLTIIGFVRRDSQFITMGAIFILFTLAVGVYNIIMLSRLPKDVQNKNPEVIRDGVTYDFTFKEKSVDIIIINSGKKKKINYSYFDFKKIYEYDDLFEIRLQSKEVLLCLKDGFENDKEKMMDFFIKNVSTNKKLVIIDKREAVKKLK